MREPDPLPSAATAAAAADDLSALRFGPFVLDRRGGRLLRDGRPLEIAPRPWALLCHLAARPGQLVTKDELLDTVWGHRFVSDSALKVAMNALRQALGEPAQSATWVQTVPRRGYRFHDAGEPLAEAQAAARLTAASPGAAATSAAPAAPAALAAPGVPSAPRPMPLGNLPAALGPLIGRDQALAALAAALPGHRLITLTGPGGVGKTRLALAAAAGLAPPAGVWLLRLDDLAEAAAVGRQLARLLGLGDAAGDSPEALARALASMQLTLVLDNAEHLADGLAPQVAHWLAHVPGLQLLVTSQRPLQLGGERVWPVPPLALPAPGASTPEVRDNPAVALMVAWVQARRPDWQPTPGDLAELAATVQALDGLPLALELAAARVPLLGAAGVRQRLDARLQMLTGGRADLPPRQRTLRASLTWSLGLLPPVAARLLDRLAVFAGGFSAEAAQAVATPALPEADEWALLDALSLLQEMALLAPMAASATGGPGAADPAPVPRLRLLDSVRLLCLERLAAAGDLAAAQAAHRAWVLRLCRAADEAYFEMGAERWLTPALPEAENLVAAVERGLAALEAAPADAAAELATELAALLAAATHLCLRAGLGLSLKRWRSRLADQLAARGAVLPPPVQARWCLGGALLGGQGLLPTAEALALGEQAVALLADAPRHLQMALYVTGLYQMRLRQADALAATLARLRAAPPAAVATPHLRRLRPMLEAAIAQREGDQAGYLAFYTAFLEESRALGDRFECWRATLGVGQARFLMGDLAGAVAVMDPAADEIRAAGLWHTQVGLVSQAVFMRLARDASDETLARLREVLPLLQARGLLFSGVGDALAWVPLRQGRLADARRVQAWADACAAADPAARSHVAARLRAALMQQLGDSGGLPAAAGAAPLLDEAAVLRLVLGEDAGSGQAPRAVPRAVP